MAIRPFLDGTKFDPETQRIIGVAFEMVCVALRLTDRDDLVTGTVAKRIIELAKDGERDPERLCDGVLRHLREPPPKNQPTPDTTRP
jgi:hypothetical protein